MEKSIMEKKNIRKDSDVHQFKKGHMDVVTMGDITIGYATFEPGWKWSECVKPIVETESCQVSHTLYVISGQMHLVMDDGREIDVGSGEIVRVSPGHDAWTVGNEPCIGLELTGARSYAQK